MEETLINYPLNRSNRNFQFLLVLEVSATSYFSLFFLNIIFIDLREERSENIHILGQTCDGLGVEYSVLTPSESTLASG